MTSRLIALIAGLEKAGTVIASVFMFAIMMIVVGDVVMRYAFNQPFSWAYDMISLYLMAGLFYFVLSAAYAARAHVGVEILYEAMSGRLRFLVDVVISVVGCLVFALIAYVAYWRAEEAFQTGDVLSGAIPWPTWPALALVPLGAGLLALRLALHTVASLLNLAAGREMVPLGSHTPTGGAFE